MGAHPQGEHCRALCGCWCDKVGTLLSAPAFSCRAVCSGCQGREGCEQLLALPGSVTKLCDSREAAGELGKGLGAAEDGCSGAGAPSCGAGKGGWARLTQSAGEGISVSRGLVRLGGAWTFSQWGGGSPFQCLRTPGSHLGKPRCPRAACICGGVSVVLPKAEQLLLWPCQGLQSSPFRSGFHFSQQGKRETWRRGKQFATAKAPRKASCMENQTEQEKQHFYYQYNTAEVSSLEIIISDSSSKNKGQKLEEARKHGRGSESR